MILLFLWREKLKRLTGIILILLLNLVALTIITAEDKPKQDFSQQLSYGIINRSASLILKSLLNSSEYLVTPGDVYRFTIKANRNISTSLIVHNDYTLEIPYLGTINTKGLKYSQLREVIIKRIKETVPTDYIEFTLETPAEYEVFINGYVKKPGIIIANSTMRLTDVIGIAGGFKKQGSFRKIRLIRRDEATSVIDLSLFSKTGDDRYNPNIKLGDRIFVPKAETIVKITGEVPFPGFFQLLQKETLKDLIKFAGGFLPEANSKEIEIQRILENGKYTSILINYNQNVDFKLHNGDIVSINSATLNAASIIVEGALYGKPNDGKLPIQLPKGELINIPHIGKFNLTLGKTPVPIFVILPYYPGISLYDVLVRLGGPTPYAIVDKCSINNDEKGKKIIFNVKTMWEHKEKASKILLEPEDHIIVPMEYQFVTVGGEVQSPGRFPYIYGKNVSDYIFFAGGMKNTTNKDNIYLYGNNGKRLRKIDMNDKVSPEQIIFLDKTIAVKTFDFANTSLPFLTTIYNFVYIFLRIFGVINW